MLDLIKILKIILKSQNDKNILMLVISILLLSLYRKLYTACLSTFNTISQSNIRKLRYFAIFSSHISQFTNNFRSSVLFSIWNVHVVRNVEQV